MQTPNYSAAERILHKIALGFSPVTELSFDIESAFTATPEESRLSKHVFVFGLARAGTTILMRAFHETGEFRSLTYRDMPFVLMPNIWNKISKPFQKKGELTDRAHNDGILVDYDSPEAFEEVFWRIHCDEYIRMDRLIPHSPGQETIDKFRKYIDLILNSASSSTHKRYLSKNNNNLLRVGCIRKAFPNAIMIIPFRNPIEQATSLLTQHRRFGKDARNDRFTTQYMKYLGHHEFGADHRPFVFSENDLDELKTYSPDSLDYWLKFWTNTYQFLLEQGKAAECVFLSFEELCTNPERTMENLFGRSGVSSGYQQIKTKITPREPVQTELHLSDFPFVVSTFEELVELSRMRD